MFIMMRLAALRWAFICAPVSPYATLPSVTDGLSHMRPKRESGGNPELSRSGKQERPPSNKHCLTRCEMGSDGQ